MSKKPNCFTLMRPPFVLLVTYYVHERTSYSFGCDKKQVSVCTDGRQPVGSWNGDRSKVDEEARTLSLSHRPVLRLRSHGVSPKDPWRSSHHGRDRAARLCQVGLPEISTYQYQTLFIHGR